jgi:hypothetical protein
MIMITGLRDISQMLNEILKRLERARDNKDNST